MVRLAAYGVMQDTLKNTRREGNMEGYEEKQVDVNAETDPYFEAFRFKSFVKNNIEDEDFSIQIGVVCSELVSNIVKRGEKGTIKCTIHPVNNGARIELIAQDLGKGLDDLHSLLHDPESLNPGIPAVKRIMDEMEIRTHKGRGTTIIAKKTLR